MKIFKIALLIIMSAVLFFTGCRKDSEFEDIFGTEIKRANLEPVTLTFYIYGFSQTYWSERIDEINKALAKDLNVTLQFELFLPYAYNGALEKLATENRNVDIMITGWDPEVYEKAFSLGWAADLTDLFPKYAPKYYARLDDKLRNYFSMDGRIYGIPNNLVYKYSPCAVVREDLYEKYADGPIKSIEDLEKYLAKVVQNEKGIIPLSFDYNQSLLNLYANSLGYVILDGELGLVYKRDDPEMKIMAWEDMDEFEDIVAKAYSWYTNGFIRNRFFYIDMYANLDTAIWAAWICNQLSVTELNAVLYEKNSEYRYLEFPLFPDNKNSQIYYNMEGIMINANTKHPERAVMLIEWIHANQENYDLIRYGAKNRQYKLKGDQYYLPEGVNVYDTFINWMNSFLIDIPYERTHIANPPDYMKDVLETYNDPSGIPPHHGFRLDRSRMNYQRRITDRYMIEHEINMGRFSADMVDEYREYHKTWGIDEIVAEAQLQLDTWRAENGK